MEKLCSVTEIYLIFILFFFYLIYLIFRTSKHSVNLESCNLVMSIITQARVHF